MLNKYHWVSIERDMSKDLAVASKAAQISPICICMSVVVVRPSYENIFLASMDRCRGELDSSTEFWKILDRYAAVY